MDVQSCIDEGLAIQRLGYRITTVFRESYLSIAS